MFKSAAYLYPSTGCLKNAGCILTGDLTFVFWTYRIGLTVLSRNHEQSSFRHPVLILKNLIMLKFDPKSYLHRKLDQFWQTKNKSPFLTRYFSQSTLTQPLSTIRNESPSRIRLSSAPLVYAILMHAWNEFQYQTTLICWLNFSFLGWKIFSKIRTDG